MEKFIAFLSWCAWGCFNGVFLVKFCIDANSVKAICTKSAKNY